jgi:histidinol-phosphate phosphatase family protein
MKRAAVFLDRDGTLINERGYLNDPARIHFYRSVVPALKILRKAGFRLVVITNQSGIGRGLVTLRQLEQIHRRFRALLKSRGAAVDAIFFCPHLPDDGCSCRKPRTALPRRAARRFHLDLRRSFVVGDQLRDVEMARNMGGRGILVLTGAGRQNRKAADRQGAAVTPNVLAAAKWIVRNSVKFSRSL